MRIIEFYLHTDPWGELSNFHPAPIHLDGQRWPTTEHYFQAAKFPGTPHAELIRLAATPDRAKQLGGDRAAPLRADWLAVRDEVMRTALRAKFTQHEQLRALLLDTADAQLVEHAVNDHYWGDGGDGSGVNRLGLLLMQVRAELS
mgnify:CR=1 FL=1|jgi:ribA/ribD-fused uncharacterized protein